MTPCLFYNDKQNRCVKKVSGFRTFCVISSFEVYQRMKLYIAFLRNNTEIVKNVPKMLLQFLPRCFIARMLRVVRLSLTSTSRLING